MFYSGALLKTVAQETASQIALRNFSKEVREEPAYIRIFAETKTPTCSQASQYYC